MGGNKGKRTLFTVAAKCVDIHRYSIFAEEGEYLLLPGSQFVVVGARHERGGLWTVELRHDKLRLPVQHPRWDTPSKPKVFKPSVRKPDKRKHTRKKLVPVLKHSTSARI